METIQGKEERLFHLYLVFKGRNSSLDARRRIYKKERVEHDDCNPRAL
jgi:hypothetical protein